MAVRVAAALWIVLAVLVWNVAFDRVLVVAGRRYVHAAALAARGPGPFLLVEDWMGPARARGLGIATTAAAAVLVVGGALIGFAAIRRPEGEP